MSNIENVFFEDDLKKIKDAVEKYPLGSYQMGEIARLSALLSERGIDVIEHLERLCEKYRINK